MNMSTFSTTALMASVLFACHENHLFTSSGFVLWPSNTEQKHLTFSWQLIHTRHYFRLVKHHDLIWPDSSVNKHVPPVCQSKSGWTNVRFLTSKTAWHTLPSTIRKLHLFIVLKRRVCYIQSKAYVYFIYYLYIGMSSTCQFATSPWIGSPKYSKIGTYGYQLNYAGWWVCKGRGGPCCQQKPWGTVRTNSIRSIWNPHWSGALNTNEREMSKETNSRSGWRLGTMDHAKDLLHNFLRATPKIRKSNSPNETGQYSSIGISCQRRSSSKYRVQD